MATHPLTTSSNIVLSRSHMVNTKDWHPSNKVMATPLKSCERPHWCSVITVNVLWKSTHSIIISHSPPPHNITISNHPDSLKSCAMAQQHHQVELTSSQTISGTTWSDQGSDGKERQWYCSMIRRTRVVKACNGAKGGVMSGSKWVSHQVHRVKVWIWVWYRSNQKVK